VFGDGLAQARHRGIEPSAVFALQLVGVGGDEGIDQAEQAGMLLRHCFRMDPGHPRRDDFRAHLREQGRQFFHPRRRRLQALRQRRELARHQVVDRAAGQAAVALRIPGPGLQGFGGPDVAAQLVAQDRGIHLVLARERLRIDRIQFRQQLLAEIECTLAAGRTDIVELGIEAVVADLGGRHRVQRQPAFQPALGEFGEPCIRLRGRSRCGRR
jgi:hypothetical protein